MPARGTAGFVRGDQVEDLVRWLPGSVSDVVERALAEALRREGGRAGAAGGGLVVRWQLRDRELLVDIRVGDGLAGVVEPTDQELTDQESAEQEQEQEQEQRQEQARRVRVCSGAPAWSGPQRSE